MHGGGGSPAAVAEQHHTGIVTGPWESALLGGGGGAVVSTAPLLPALCTKVAQADMQGLEGQVEQGHSRTPQRTASPQPALSPTRGHSPSVPDPTLQAVQAALARRQQREQVGQWGVRQLSGEGQSGGTVGMGESEGRFMEGGGLFPAGLYQGLCGSSLRICGCSWRPPRRRQAISGSSCPRASVRDGQHNNACRKGHGSRRPSGKPLRHRGDRHRAAECPASCWEGGTQGTEPWHDQH